MPLSVRSLLPLSLALAGTSACAAQSDIDRALNPHAATVRQAIVPVPGDPAARALNPNGNRTESADCRRLRLQMEASRYGEPKSPRPSLVSGGTSHDGRPLNVSGGSIDYGETGRLEARYADECR